MSRKILDTSKSASSQSKADKSNKKIYYYLKSFRKPYLNLEKLLDFNKVDVLDRICKLYKIKDIDFGNWTSQTQRYNFTLALYISLYDLQRILKFKNNNLGFNVLSIGYGSRGTGGALAQYQPVDKYINLSRERRKDKYPAYNKDELIEQMSGFGSFAHEYGHFLDYHFGKISGGRTMAISGGSALLPPITLRYSKLKHDPQYYLDFFDKTIIQNTSNNIRECMYNIFVGAFLKKTGRPTDFYYRLYAHAKYFGDYWRQMNEIWARIFEIYIVYKLRLKNTTNKVLVSEGRGKYSADFDAKGKKAIYMTFGEISKISKDIDLLIELMNKQI